MEKIDEILSSNIHRLRKTNGWSQEDLANKADVSWGAIQNIESRRSWPGLKTIRSIAHALNVDETELFMIKGREIDAKEAVIALCRHHKIAGKDL